jgi:predicted nuclease of predicted toxin-antitoxin system
LNPRSSKRSSASERPSLLIDHSLGTIAVPKMFRENGFDTHTVSDIFGNTATEDVEWIRYAHEHRMVVACKDSRIRSNLAERRMLAKTTVRVLCLTNRNLTSARQVAWFRNNIVQFDRLWHEEGPWVFGVYEHRIERLKLYDH